MKPEQTSEELKAIAVKVFSDTLSEFKGKINKAWQESAPNAKLKPKYKYILSLNLDNFANEYELIKAKQSKQPKAYRDLLMGIFHEGQRRYFESVKNKEQ